MLTPAEVDERQEAPPLVSEAHALDVPPVPAATHTDAVPETSTPAMPNRRGLRLSTLACFGISIATVAVAIAMGQARALQPIATFVAITGGILFLVSTLVALTRAVVGIAVLIRAAWARDTAGLGDTIAAVLGNLLMTALGMLVGFMSTMGFSRGRQLRRFGKVLLPGLRPDGDWTTATAELHGHEEVPAGLAQQWRENGKTEHASVAAFARLTLDLMALGAPPKLIAAANQDALDEIRHTELCFSIARALDGKCVSPAPFPDAQRARTLPRSRTLALAKLAVDSLIDGALHEGVSARIIARLAQRCEVPAIRAALKEIAADEGRHAAHGWTAVEWCLDQGGRPVAHALLGAIRTLPGQMRSQLPAAAADGGWERWGIHGHPLESEEYRAALAHLAGRVQARVAARSSQAA